MLPGDPILYAVVVIGAFIYYALKGSGEETASRALAGRKRTPAKLREDECSRQQEIVSWFEKGYTGRCQGEYERYVLWLYQHRDGKRPPTLEEIVEDYRKRREEERTANEEKRRREWLRYKQSPEYEKEMERIERYLNR